MRLTAFEEYLIDFHDRRPGATSHCFGNAQTQRDGKPFASPYACLADVVPFTEQPLTVLDLACGDGYLLAELAARRHPGLALVGVDMSLGELAKARDRLGGNAALLCEKAQALSIASGSVDIVLSHMALMLMDDVELVLREVRRVLKPGGVFSAVVGGGKPAGEAFDVWVRLLRPAMEADGVAGMRFGDARTRTETGWRQLLADGFADVRMHDLDVSCDASPTALWEWFSCTYDVDLLSAARREGLRVAFLKEIAPLANSEGMVQCIDRLRQVAATAA